MLLDLAIGDAFGAGFEGIDNRAIDGFLSGHRQLKYAKHPKHNITSGNYTDDAQMASVVAEVMLSGNFTQQALAGGWVQRFKIDKRPGYTPRFYSFLNSCKNGSDFLAKINNSSILSGAAMRASPIGLYRDKDEVKEKAMLQGLITHRDSGFDAAIVAALMVHYFVHEKKPKAGLRGYIAKEIDTRYAMPWRGRPRYDVDVSALGWQCASAAISAVMDNNNIPDLLRQCIRYGGDTDTVASIAMAAASCSQEYRAQHDRHGNGWDKRFPVNLYNGLEPEYKTRKFGREYLKGLDQRLWNAVRQKRL